MTSPGMTDLERTGLVASLGRLDGQPNQAPAERTGGYDANKKIVGRKR